MTVTTHAVPLPRGARYSMYDSSLLSPDAVEILLRSSRNIGFEHELVARSRTGYVAVALATVGCIVSFLDLALMLHG
jgi:hypothetical protein